MWIDMEKLKRRICLCVAYDGTYYHGWQYQENKKTIEGELNKALSKLLGEEITVIGASRTDAGVHALCNQAVFDTASTIPADKFPYALNPLLPKSIRIRGSKETTADFHPRKVRSIKTYEYRIDCEEFPNPLKERYAFFTHTPLNVEKMRQAGAFLVGEHDFTSFCNINSTAKTRIRTVTAVDVLQNESDIIIRVTGQGFLYNMVRIIAGTLIEVGRGRYGPKRVKEMLDLCDRCAAGPTVPACGLILVDYRLDM